MRERKGNLGLLSCKGSNMWLRYHCPSAFAHSRHHYSILELLSNGPGSYCPRIGFSHEMKPACPHCPGILSGPLSMEWWLSPEPALLPSGPSDSRHPGCAVRGCSGSWWFCPAAAHRLLSAISTRAGEGRALLLGLQQHPARRGSPSPLPVAHLGCFDICLCDTDRAHPLVSPPSSVTLPATPRAHEMLALHLLHSPHFSTLWDDLGMFSVVESISLKGGKDGVRVSMGSWLCSSYTDLCWFLHPGLTHCCQSVTIWFYSCRNWDLKGLLIFSSIANILAMRPKGRLTALALNNVEASQPWVSFELWDTSLNEISY